MNLPACTVRVRVPAHMQDHVPLISIGNINRFYTAINLINPQAQDSIP